MEAVTEIIEIVFEKVQLDRIVDFLIVSLSNSQLRDYTVSTDSSKIELESKESLNKSIIRSSDGAFYFNFINFYLKDILLPRAGLQILKYGESYDMNLHVEKTELSENQTVPELQNCVENLAKKLKATNFYCGYEPADDEETRFFSGSIIGPLRNWDTLNT